MTLSFTFHGALVSNNMIARRVGRRVISNPEATRQKQTVYQLAYAAARAANWRAPRACAVKIVCYNTRKDVSNCEKVIGDGMIGAVYDDDSAIVELHIEKRRDLGDERYEVTVEPRAELVKPKPPRKFRYTDLDIRDLRAVAGGFGLVRAGFISMRWDEIPQAWRDRARKAVRA